MMNLLMSDYEVTLVNDNMQEFYVRFYGPTESEIFFFPFLLLMVISKDRRGIA
jgi:hypothetical protein